MADLISVLLKKTNDGADIIMSYYPLARDCFGTKRKFKIRDEHDASANWWRNPKNGRWCITDFGDDSKAKDCIDVTMEQENLSWNEALNFLLAKYGILSEGGTRQMNISFEPRSPDMAVGDYRYETAPFDAHDLEYFGKGVTEQELHDLHWIKIGVLRICLENHVLVKRSSETYPIYARECHYDENDKPAFFLKVYEPLAQDKRFRFRYLGHKPANYINGLYEAKHRKPESVVIVSGERDAIAAYHFGLFPIWFNSESALPKTRLDMAPVFALTQTVYYVPDIDNTGYRVGRKFALLFPYVHTIWLPDKLNEKKDWRGNPLKDLCDWAKQPGNDRDAFWDLVDSSLSAEYFFKDKNGHWQLSILTLHYYLWLQGYGGMMLKEGDGETLKLTKCEGCAIEEVTQASTVMKFLMDKLSRNADYHAKYNLLDKTRRTLTLECLTSVRPHPQPMYVPRQDKVCMFFDNVVVEITPESIHPVNANDYGELVMKSHQIELEYHAPKELPLQIRQEEGMIPSLVIKNFNSPLLCFLINLCRIYWQEEYVKSGLTLDEFYATHNFQINSDLLSEEQVVVQSRCFYKLADLFGFLLSPVKTHARLAAPYLIDLSCFEGISNGRSGKGLLMQYVKKMRNVVEVDGRKQGEFDYQHAFSNVTRDTDIVYINDYDPQANQFDAVYNLISDGMTVNPKHKPMFHLSFEESPKVIFSSNQMVKQEDASTSARLDYVVASNWYHKASEGNANYSFACDHTPIDDFGKELIGDYTAEDWNNDLAVIFCFVQYHLLLSKMKVRFDTPAELLNWARTTASYKKSFGEWAVDYFTEDMLGRLIPKDEAIESCKNYCGDKTISPRNFKTSLKGWADVNGYVLNEDAPENYKRSDGRVTMFDNRINKTVECIFVTKRG